MTRGGASRRGGLLVSMGLAFVFWLLHALGQEHTDTVRVRLDWGTPPADRVVVNRLPDEARLTLRSSGWNLLSARFRRQTLRLDLARFGDRNLLLTDRNHDLFARELSNAWTLLDVEPDTIRIDVDRAVQRRVPLRLATAWRYAPGFGPSGPPVLEPESVLVRGPARLVDTLRGWTLRPPAGEALDADRSGTVALAAPGDWQLDAEPEEARYRVRVEPYTEGQLRVPVSAPQSGHWRLVPAAVDVRFQAPLSRYDAIRAEDFAFGTALADSGRTLVEVVPLRRPEGIRALRWEPRRVERLRVETAPPPPPPRTP
jgi:hypothetical protein